jgi:hypothetical protein
MATPPQSGNGLLVDLPLRWTVHRIEMHSQLADHGSQTKGKPQTSHKDQDYPKHYDNPTCYGNGTHIGEQPMNEMHEIAMTKGPSDP